MTDKLKEQLDMKEKQIKFLQKKCRDAGNLINELKLRQERETQSLKNVVDMKEEQNQALRQINDDHKKLNGELRKEISNLKKEAKDMLQYP